MTLLRGPQDLGRRIKMLEDKLRHMTTGSAGFVLRLLQDEAATAISRRHPVQIGESQDANLRLDSTSVQAVNNGQVAALDLNPNGGLVRGSAVLGFDRSYTDQDGLGAGPTDLTGMACTFTVPADRMVRVTGHAMIRWPTGASAAGHGAASLIVREGTASLGRCGRIWRYQSTEAGGSGTQIGAVVEGSVIVKPTAGTHTYKLAVQRLQGDETIGVWGGSSGGGDDSIWMLVEDIGKASTWGL